MDIKGFKDRDGVVHKYDHNSLANIPETGTVTDEQIAAAVEKYLTENPVDGVTDQQVYDAVAAYLAENPVEGVTDAQISQAVADYLTENPVEVTGVVKSVNGVAPDAAGNVAITIPDSSQNAALTTAQINALDGMFKVCAFTKEDVSTEYAAFKTAFGITDSGEDTGDNTGGSDENETHTHSYTAAVTTAATCETTGVRTYTCSCGNSYTESIPATGHNYVDGVCSVCGAADPDYVAPENNGWTDGEAYAIEWTDGYKLENSTGAESENTSCSVSDYIPCLGVSALTGANISGGYLFAYDADKTYLGRIIFNASYPSPVNREVAYVKIYCSTTSKASVMLTPHVYEELTETTNLETGKYYSASYVEDTKLDQNTGATSTHTSNWTSDYMFCYGANSVTTTQIIQTSWGNKLAFYDADKNYISGASGNQIPWEAPENAVYFRLNGFDGFEYTIQKPNRPWIQFE